jgi:Uma2 family endonuclease
MSDNTLQYECIVTIKGGLDVQYADDDNVFVAGDLLWYPREGHPEVRSAPDALTAFDRPKGYRGSYKQWEEGGVAPQVVFEVLSPGNRFGELLRKFQFYQTYGVEEFYIYDPYKNDWAGYLRGSDGNLHEVPSMAGWVSPRLGIRFEMKAGDLELYHPDGRRFATYVELAKQGERERQAKEQAQQRADQEKERADGERQRADQQKERADRLAARLRTLGIDPEE